MEKYLSKSSRDNPALVEEFLLENEDVDWTYDEQMLEEEESNDFRRPPSKEMKEIKINLKRTPAKHRSDAETGIKNFPSVGDGNGGKDTGEKTTHRSSGSSSRKEDTKKDKRRNAAYLLETVDMKIQTSATAISTKPIDGDEFDIYSDIVEEMARKKSKTTYSDNSEEIIKKTFETPTVTTADTTDPMTEESTEGLSWSDPPPGWQPTDPAYSDPTVSQQYSTYNQYSYGSTSYPWPPPTDPRYQYYDYYRSQQWRAPGARTVHARFYEGDSSRRHSARSPPRRRLHGSPPITEYRYIHRRTSRSPQRRDFRRSRSPRRRHSRSPRKRESRSPRRRGSRSPRRSSPRERESRSPRSRESSSPRKRKSRSPRTRESRSPRSRESSSPRKRESRSPRRWKSRSPQRIISKSAESLSHFRRQESDHSQSSARIDSKIVCDKEERRVTLLSGTSSNIEEKCDEEEVPLDGNEILKRRKLMEDQHPSQSHSSIVDSKIGRWEKPLKKPDHFSFKPGKSNDPYMLGLDGAEKMRYLELLKLGHDPKNARRLAAAVKNLPSPGIAEIYPANLVEASLTRSDSNIETHPTQFSSKSNENYDSQVLALSGAERLRYHEFVSVGHNHKSALQLVAASRIKPLNPALTSASISKTHPTDSLPFYLAKTVTTHAANTRAALITPQATPHAFLPPPSIASSSFAKVSPSNAPIKSLVATPAATKEFMPPPSTAKVPISNIANKSILRTKSTIPAIVSPPTQPNPAKIDYSTYFDKANSDFTANDSSDMLPIKSILKKTSTHSAALPPSSHIPTEINFQNTLKFAHADADLNASSRSTPENSSRSKFSSSNAVPSRSDPIFVPTISHPHSIGKAQVASSTERIVLELATKKVPDLTLGKPNPVNLPIERGQSTATTSVASLSPAQSASAVAPSAADVAMADGAESSSDSDAEGTKIAVLAKSHLTDPLSSEDLVKLEDAIIETITLSAGSAQNIRFNGIKTRSGMLVLACDNDTTVEWVTNLALTLKGPRHQDLMACREVDVPKPKPKPREHGVSFFLPKSAGKDTSILLSLIGVQNTNLDVKSWRIISASDNGAGKDLKLIVDDKSKEALANESNLIHYRFGKIQVFSLENKELEALKAEQEKAKAKEIQAKENLQIISRASQHTENPEIKTKRVGPNVEQPSSRPDNAGAIKTDDTSREDEEKRKKLALEALHKLIKLKSDEAPVESKSLTLNATSKTAETINETPEESKKLALDALSKIIEMKSNETPEESKNLTLDAISKVIEMKNNEAPLEPKKHALDTVPKGPLFSRRPTPQVEPSGYSVGHFSDQIPDRSSMRSGAFSPPSRRSGRPVGRGGHSSRGRTGSHYDMQFDQGSGFEFGGRAKEIEAENTATRAVGKKSGKSDKPNQKKVITEDTDEEPEVTFAEDPAFPAPEWAGLPLEFKSSRGYAPPRPARSSRKRGKGKKL